jgi:DNA-binding XRE family transcriptional regulator
LQEKTEPLRFLGEELSMKKSTSQIKKELESKGFKTGTVAEFLDLSPEDEAWIEMKRALRDKVVELRRKSGITQAQLADRLGSRQPRISKLEAGNDSVGYDLLMKSLLALGATPTQIGAVISRVGHLR